MSILKNKKMITFSRDIIPTNLDETDALVTSIESDADDHEKQVTLKKSKTKLSQMLFPQNNLVGFSPQ